MILSAAELADIRSDLSDLLPDTCVVTRVTRTRNDSGGWTETTVDSDPIACRLGPPGFGSTGRERTFGGRVVEESDAVLTVSYDADIDGADRITHNGTTYEVVDVLERSELLVKRVYLRAQT